MKRVGPAFDLRYFDGGRFMLDEYVDAVAEAMVGTFPDRRNEPAHGSTPEPHSAKVAGSNPAGTRVHER